MTQKKCNRCNEVKSLNNFSRNGKLGHHPVCKSCRSEIGKAYRLANIDAVREAEKVRYFRNHANKRTAQGAYYQKNKDKKLAQEKARYERDKERIKARASNYRQGNKAKIYEWNGTRRAALREAVPIWANRAEIANIYKQARDLSNQFGVKYHVDHIIPLSHELVCGLHIPINLQIIQATDNLTKSNKFDCSKY